MIKSLSPISGDDLIRRHHLAGDIVYNYFLLKKYPLEAYEYILVFTMASREYDDEISMDYLISTYYRLKGSGFLSLKNSPEGHFVRCNEYKWEAYRGQRD